MATVTFDTLKLAARLKAAGFAPEQAEAVVRVIADAQDELLTRKDLAIALTPLTRDLAIIKWMLGLLLAGVVALVLKTFFA